MKTGGFLVFDLTCHYEAVELDHVNRSIVFFLTMPP